PSPPTPHQTLVSLSAPLVFINALAPHETSPLPLHDALPICALTITALTVIIGPVVFHYHLLQTDLPVGSAELVHIERAYRDALADRKSTRLNSSHVSISYAVSCLKKKNDSTMTPLTIVHDGD